MKNCINLIIDKSGKSQAQVAKLINLDRSSLNRIASGNLDPSLKKAFALADVLSCNVDDLFFPTKEEMFGNSRKNK